MDPDERSGGSTPDEAAEAGAERAGSGARACGPKPEPERAGPEAGHDRVRERFAPAAQAYVESPTHAAGAELATMVALAREALDGLEGREALDVATGGGHVARVLAEAGASVTATDLTPEMLRAAEGHVRERVPGARVRFVAAPAEAMPFPDGAFGLVTCRIAAHHFVDPEAFVAEAHRLLAPGGLLLVVDNVGPEDRALADVMNEVEKLRDPSHVEAYSVSRWVAWLAGRGFEVVRLERFWRVKDLLPWLERGGTPPGARARLLERLATCPPAARAYLLPDGASVDPTGTGAGVLLRHEVMLLAAERR